MEAELLNLKRHDKINDTVCELIIYNLNEW